MNIKSRDKISKYLVLVAGSFFVNYFKNDSHLCSLYNYHFRDYFEIFKRLYVNKLEIIRNE